MTKKKEKYLTTVPLQGSLIINASLTAYLLSLCIFYLKEMMKVQDCGNDRFFLQLYSGAFLNLTST